MINFLSLLIETEGSLKVFFIYLIIVFVGVTLAVEFLRNTKNTKNTKEIVYIDVLRLIIFISIIVLFMESYSVVEEYIRKVNIKVDVNVPKEYSKYADESEKFIKHGDKYIYKDSFNLKRVKDNGGYIEPIVKKDVCKILNIDMETYNKLDREFEQSLKIKNKEKINQADLMREEKIKKNKEKLEKIKLSEEDSKE